MSRDVFVDYWPDITQPINEIHVGKLIQCLVVLGWGLTGSSGIKKLLDRYIRIDRYGAESVA